jgi:hypothetical protein
LTFENCVFDFAGSLPTCPFHLHSPPASTTFTDSPPFQLHFTHLQIQIQAATLKPPKNPCLSSQFINPIIQLQPHLQTNPIHGLNLTETISTSFSNLIAPITKSSAPNSNHYINSISTYSSLLTKLTTSQSTITARASSPYH